MINAIQTTQNYATGCIRYAAQVLCGGRDRKPQLHIVGGMRAANVSTTQIEKIQARIDRGDFSRATAVAKLKEIERDPINLKAPLHFVCGYAHVDSKCIGTNMKAKLSRYIDDLSRVMVHNFFSATFRNMSLEDCAIEVIEEIHASYKSSLADEIKINVACHSMGAAIMSLVCERLQRPYRGKKYTILNLVSLNGANRGAPVAHMSRALFCFKKNVAKDLRPGAIEFKRHEAEKVLYLSAKGDSVIPVEYSAPEGQPVVILNDVNPFFPHTLILNSSVAMMLVLLAADS